MKFQILEVLEVLESSSKDRTIIHSRQSKSEGNSCIILMELVRLIGNQSERCTID
jgi:hypothetical protein